MHNNRETSHLKLYVMANIPSGSTHITMKFEQVQYIKNLMKCVKKQVAQWATIAHHGASIIFGDTIIYDAQRQMTLNLKQ